MLHENFKTFKSHSNPEQVDLTILGKEEEDLIKPTKAQKRLAKQAKQKGETTNDEQMELDQEIEEVKDECADPMQSIIAFKNLLIKVLTDNELDQKRDSKMEILDFLTLLNVMNASGVHFK